MTPDGQAPERYAAADGRSWRRADFDRQARDALAHLYDVAYLQTHPLADLALDQSGRRDTRAGLALRQALLETIDALRPPIPEQAMAEAWRGYRILTLHYIDGLGVGEVLTELAISRSTYNREAQRAMQAALSLLWTRWGLSDSDERPGPSPAEPPSPSGRVTGRPETVLHLVSSRQPPANQPRGHERDRHNLPLPVTSFVGRERERGAVTEALNDTRLLTLTGSGGCGKTRLALQVAADLLGRFADGVWLVDLAPLAEPDLVAVTAAGALGVRIRAGQSIVTTLQQALIERQLLLVLDNCEHLIDASARLAEALIRSCPAVRVLATSREPLRIAGEVIWRVPSLAVPTMRRSGIASDVFHAEAVQLFAERARAVQPAFVVTEDNAASVGLVCQRLDGIPLAIELAAARLRALTVGQIAQRLDDRFHLLSDGHRTALPRHRTLRAMIDWSHDLLTDDERIVIRRLAVFAGGCSLEAAEAVCAGVGGRGSGAGGRGLGIGEDRSMPNSRPPTPTDVLDLLTHLVDKSLVLAEEVGGEARYRLLETVRQYAWERLEAAGEAANMRARHAAWCLTLAERIEPMLATTEQVAGLNRLDVDHDNLRAALAWSLEADAETGLRLAAALWPYWRVRGFFHEGRRWLDDLLARTSAHTAARAKALLGAGRLIFYEADRAGSMLRYRESLTVSREIGEPALANWALRELAQTLIYLGEYDQAETALHEGLALARASDDATGLGGTLMLLGQVAEWRGDMRQAQALSGEGLAVLRGTGDDYMVASALLRVGRAAMTLSDAAGARAAFEEGLVLSRALGAPTDITRQLNHLGQLACWEGDAERARPFIEASLALAREHDEALGIAIGVLDLGRTALVAGNAATAQPLLIEAVTLLRQAGIKRAVAMGLLALGQATWNLGNRIEATARWRECLALQQEMGDRIGIAQCLEGLAAVALDRPELAARFLAVADRLREATGAPRSPAERPFHATTLAGARAALGEAGFAAAWADGRALSVDAVVVTALAE